MANERDSKISNLKSWLDYCFFIGLIASGVVYVGALLLLQITAPADGYSGSADYFSTTGFTIDNVLIERPNGLQKGDLIIAVGGKTVEEWLAIAFTGVGYIPNVTQVEQLIPYTIIRDGQEQIIPIKLERLSLWLILSRWGSTLFINLAMLSIGIFVFLKKPQETAARALLLFTLTFFVQVNSIDTLGIQFSEVINRRPFLTFLAADLFEFGSLLGAGLYLALIFPLPKQFTIRHRHLMFSLYILPSLVTVPIAWLWGQSWSERIVIATWLNSLMALVMLVIALSSLVHSYWAAPNVIARNQMRWIIWGSITPITIWLLLFALPTSLLGHALLPVSIIVLPFILIVVSFAFSIIKYRLMDIDTVINQSLVYLTLTTLLGILYFLAVTLLARVLQLLNLSNDNNGLFFVSTILIALVFSPLRDRVQLLIDHAFYRNKLNFRHLLDELSQELTTTIILSDLTALLIKTVPHRLNITHADLIMLDYKKQLLSTRFDLPLTVPQELPLVDKTELCHYFLTTQRALLVTSLSDEEISSKPCLGWLVELLKRQGLELCLPLVVGQKLIGLYALGPKRSLEFYNSEEIGALAMLSRQATTAIENSRLYVQIATQERLKQELEIAHQIQMDLLPKTVPQVPGLEIAGYSMPAQEVGGDFYAYYYLPDGQFGIAVGDVSGKGLPGALYMAISASILEAHAPSYQRVGQLLNVVNRTLYPRMRARRMNTALAYLLFDPVKCNVQVSNAGLIAPLLVRGGQTMRYLDPNNLSLGCIAESSYHENTFNLEQHDMVVLISDGIVEAMNPAHELYGFERFESLIGHYRSHYTAQEVVNEILADVQQFVDGAPQHDDMTIVVVLVREK